MNINALRKSNIFFDAAGRETSFEKDARRFLDAIPIGKMDAFRKGWRRKVINISHADKMGN